MTRAESESARAAAYELEALGALREGRTPWFCRRDRAHACAAAARREGLDVRVLAIDQGPWQWIVKVARPAEVV